LAGRPDEARRGLDHLRASRQVTPNR
jgi:hypothetical protein